MVPYDIAARGNLGVSQIASAPSSNPLSRTRIYLESISRRPQPTVPWLPSRSFRKSWFGPINSNCRFWSCTQAHTWALAKRPGLAKIVESIDRVLAGLPKTKTRIALETTAGQGSCLGHRFEHLAYIIANVREPERLCVCLDTAHVFAAGYELATEKLTRKTFVEFDRIVGLEHLAALHLNDSKTARGSRVDRHEHIGKGRIGLEAFRFIMRDRRFRKIPKVLETPKGKELKEDVENMRTLRSLL